MKNIKHEQNKRKYIITMQVYSAKETVIGKETWHTENSLGNITQRIEKKCWHIDKIRIYLKMIKQWNEICKREIVELKRQVKTISVRTDQEPETLLVILTERVKELLIKYGRIEKRRR